MALAGALEIQMFASIARLSKDMQDAKTVVGGAMKNIEGAVSMAKQALGALGIGIGLVGFVHMVKGALDTQDALNKMSQKVNETVENLVGLKHAFELGGVQMEAVQKGLGALASQMFDASMGLAESKRNFAALGIEIMKADGTMKSTTAVLLEMSDQMAKTGTSTTNMALAKKLLGKAGLDLIPVLQGGSEEMRRMMEEGQRLYPVTAENARQAEILNDNLMILGKEIKSGGIRTMNAVVPGINEVTEAMKTAAKEAGLLTAAWVGLGGAMAFALGMTGAQKEAKHLEDITNKLAEVRKQLQQGFIIPGQYFTPEAQAKLIKQLYALEAERARIAAIGTEKEETARAEAAKKAKAAAALAAHAKALEEAEKAAKENAARDKRLNTEGIKGWVAYVEARTKEYEDGLKEMEKLADEESAHEKSLRDIGIAGYVAMAEAKVQADFNEAQQLAKDQIDAAKQIEDAKKKIDDERLREQKRVADETDRMIGDAIMRGFERGEDAAKNFRDTLVNMFKTLVLRPVISAVMSPVTGAIGATLGGMGLSGSANAAGNGLSLLSSANNSGLFSMGLTGMADYAAGFATTATASQAAAAAMIESGTVGFAGAGMEAGAAGAMGFSAAIPYIGAAVLAMYALGVFDSDEREKVLIGTGVTGRITRGGLQGSLASNWGTGPNDRWGGTTLSELPAAALATINNTINNVFTNMTDAAKKMGLSVADLSDIVVDFTTSSQNGDQTANDLNAALAATSDAIALKLIPNIQSLQYQGESLTQTFARLAAAQAALDAQKRTMEIQLMEAQGKAVEALAAKREDELAALNATLKPLQQMIYAAQDLSTAFTDAQTAAQDAVSGQLDSARSLSQAFQQVTKSINDSITQLRGGALSPLTSAQKYADARQQLGAAFAASSGDAEMTAKLPGLVNTFLAASRDMNSSSAAYTKDYEKAMSMLNRAAEFSAASVSEQDALIATLTDLSTAIQDAAKNDENVALLREISDKLSNGGTGNAGTFLAQLVALNGTAETRKAAEDAAHAKALVDDQSSISRLAAQIENARQTMGSVTDPSAVSYYQREIELWEATLAKARTDYLILSGGIPSHASGLSTVPYDNYLMKAHAGEAVLTRSQASDWRSGSQGITSEDLRALRADVQRMTAIIESGDRANVQATERVAQVQETAAWREEIRPSVK